MAAGVRLCGVDAGAGCEKQLGVASPVFRRLSIRCEGQR